MTFDNRPAVPREQRVKPVEGVLLPVMKANGVEGWRVLAQMSGDPMLINTIRDSQGGLYGRPRFQDQMVQPGQKVDEWTVNEVQALPLVVGNLARDFKGVGEAWIVASEFMQATFGNGSDYVESLGRWMAYFGKEINDANYKGMVRRWANKKWRDGRPYFNPSYSLDWNKYAAETDVLLANDGRVILSEYMVGSDRFDEQAKQAIGDGLRSVMNLFGAPKAAERSVRVLIVPKENLTIGGLRNGNEVVLTKDKGRVLGDIAIHEFAHLVLAKYGVTYFDEILEGAADGVKLALWNDGEHINRQRNKMPKLVDSARKIIKKKGEEGVRVSATALLDEDESGDEIKIQGKSYEMSNVVVAMALLFPREWPTVLKCVYEATSDRNRTDARLYDDSDGSLLLRGGELVERRRNGAEIRRRDVFHAALKRGLSDALGNEGLEAANKRAMMEFGINQSGRKTENVATMVEALAVAMMGKDAVKS